MDQGGWGIAKICIFFSSCFPLRWGLAYVLIAQADLKLDILLPGVLGLQAYPAR